MKFKMGKEPIFGTDGGQSQQTLHKVGTGIGT